jgi:hypothetical protein
MRMITMSCNIDYCRGLMMKTASTILLWRPFFEVKQTLILLKMMEGLLRRKVLVVVG